MSDILAQIDQTTGAFKQTFFHLNEDQLNWKPNSKTWSIAQNIEHLITINDSYNPVIKAVREGNLQLPFVAKIGFIVSWFGNVILKSVLPNRKRKTKTFPIWEPGSSQIGGDILDRFVRHQVELKILIDSSQDLIEQGAIISSPANKNVVYKLEKAFEIIVTHEQRHLEQAKEVLQVLKI